jgi:hypothetical protein
VQALQLTQIGGPGIDDRAGQAQRPQDDAEFGLRAAELGQVLAVMDQDRERPQRVSTATPGRSLPSMNSRNAPPAVET